jgi:hypothetical protein
VKPGTRAAATVVGFAVVAAATGFVVAWFGGDGSVSHWLLAYAGSLEFWGVLLVASPELAPYLRRLAAGFASLRSHTKVLAHRASARARRILGLRPRPIVMSGTSAVSGGGAMRGRGIVGLSEEASLEEKVDFLMRREEETQHRLADLQEEQDALPARWRDDIEAKAGTLRREQREGLDELRDEHLTARVGGVVLLVAGLFLATWGNLA